VSKLPRRGLAIAVIAGASIVIAAPLASADTRVAPKGTYIWLAQPGQTTVDSESSCPAVTAGSYAAPSLPTW
jgi:hypothetical protein